MKMKITVSSSTLTGVVSIIAFSLGLSACAELPLYETDHPGYGVITLTTDWSNRMQGVAVPESYQVRIGEEYDELLQGGTNLIDYPFSPDNYRIRIYNPVGAISVEGTKASVALTDGFADAEPDWFFTASEEMAIAGDKDESLAFVMQQQVRQLSFVFTVASNRTSRITGINAVLEGVAGSLDIDKGEVTGTPVSVKPVFKEQSEDVYQGTVRLLGVTGDTQTLRVKLSFRGGVEVTLPAVNISYLLADFNADKKAPLLLSTQIVENQTELGLTIAFGEWKKSQDIMVIVYD
jgi:hypothetical protein